MPRRLGGKRGGTGMSSEPDFVEELAKLGPNVAERLGRVREFLKSPQGRSEALPATAADVERLEEKMARRRPERSLAESTYLGMKP